MYRPKFLMGALVAAIAALAAPAKSQADFQLIIRQGASVVYDSGLIIGATHTVPAATYGDYNILFVGGFSNTPGNPTLGQLDVDTFRITRVGSASGLDPLTVSISANNYNAPPLVGTVDTRLDGRFSSTATGSVGTGTLESYFNTSNALFGTTTLVGSTSFTPSAPANAFYSAIQPGYSGTYSLTTILTFDDMSVNDIVEGGATTNALVPAPAGLILAATAVPFVGLLRRRLRRPEATTAV
jgi:hypothetical protein